MMDALTHFDPLSVAVLTFVTLQRLAELVYARSNEARLLARGAREHGAGHYPVLVAMHATWLIGLWVLAAGITPQPVWLLAFAVLQGLRVWVLATLKSRWTTRVIVLPNEPLVHAGLYRLIPHPNYAVVAAELFVLPMAYGLHFYALLFTALNAAVLWVRIHVEEKALREATGVPNPAAGRPQSN